MRPLPGAMSAHGGVHAEDNDLATPTATPLACFITTEAALDAASDVSSGPQFQPSYRYRKRSVDRNNMSTSHLAPSRSRSRSQSRVPSSPALTSTSLASLSSSALELDLAPGTPHYHSSGVAPMRTGLSSVSVISSASSRRHSSGPSSQVHRDPSAGPNTEGRLHRDESSQLIMPSLPVPQRRPFSLSGKSVGKLKILVAGGPGTGKTTIIQAISQCCEHIVHMDPVIPPSAGIMSEVYASTRPRPWWQPGFDSTGSLNRRTSSGEILDRNLCFVVRSDSQYRSGVMDEEMRYIDSQLRPVLDKPLDDSDLWDLLSNGGQQNVDAVLFMISHTGLEQHDIEFLKAIQTKTNVIPLLARSDELDEEELSRSKDIVRQQLSDNDLECFSFPSRDPANSSASSMDIFAVSSLTKPDYDVMDASVLMDSGYVQPLVPTDLANLMEHICSEDGSTWLRQSTATKCIKWRRDHPGEFVHLASRTALTFRDPAKCALSPVLTVNPFGARRYWHRVEMSDWAEGLRRSLEAEQLDRMSQRASEMEALRQWGANELVRRRKRGSKSSRPQPRSLAPNLVHQDPLGVLHFASQLRRNARLVLELVSSLGLVGCFAAWLVRPERPPPRGLGILFSLEDIRWCLP